MRDIYAVGDDLLFVATDRISAFDYVLGSGIPDKGRILTQISRFWFEFLKSTVANHVVATEPIAMAHALAPYSQAIFGAALSPERMVVDSLFEQQIAERSMIVRRRGCIPWNALSGDIFPAQAGRITSRRERCAESSYRPGCASPTGCRIQSSLPRRR